MNDPKETKEEAPTSAVHLMRCSWLETRRTLKIACELVDDARSDDERCLALVNVTRVSRTFVEATRAYAEAIEDIDLAIRKSRERETETYIETLKRQVAKKTMHDQMSVALQTDAPKAVR